MEPLMIRRAKKEDIQFVLTLYRDLEGLYAQSVSTEQKLTADIAWQRLSSDPRQCLLVAELQGKIVGTLTVIIVPNIGHGGNPWAVIENVVVEEERRGCGVGKRLMEEATRLARAGGCYKLILASNILRTAAHGFYREIGWRETHVGFSLEINKQK